MHFCAGILLKRPVFFSDSSAHIKVEVQVSCFGVIVSFIYLPVNIYNFPLFHYFSKITIIINNGLAQAKNLQKVHFV